MPISVESAPIQLSLEPNSPSNPKRASRSQSRASSTSPSEGDSDDDEEDPSFPSYPAARNVHLEGSLGSLGSSWGISGVGMGFNSSWGTTESDSESGEEDEQESDEEEDGETVDVNSAGASREAMRRLELNTHLNSRTSFTGFDGVQMMSPVPLSSPSGGPRLSISNLFAPRLMSTRGAIGRTTESPSRSSATVALPLHVYPTSPVHVTSQLQAPSDEKVTPIDEVLLSQPTFPLVSRPPRSDSPAPQRSCTLPTPPSHSAPLTRRGSPVITTTDRPRISSSPPSAQSSLPPDSSAPPSLLRRAAVTPPRPSMPVRSVSSTSFGSATTPRVRSRRRNASSNRISLVAGRQVPLPFDPTAEIDPLPPLIPSTSTPQNSIVSREPESSLTELGAPERQSRFPDRSDQIRYNAGCLSMPIIPPLLRPPQAPPSRIPSATSVSAPIRPLEPNDSNILSPPAMGPIFASAPVSAVPSEGDAAREGATSLSRSSSKRSTGHRHRKSRSKDKESTVISGGRSVNDFVITGEAGRGAYGLVKRVREKLPDGSLGPLLIMKQVIKSRILADCWKKHAVYGTIPIEIHVMAAISSNEYILPTSRPWDPLRFDYWARGRSCSNAIAPLPDTRALATDKPSPLNVDSLIAASPSPRASTMHTTPHAVGRHSVARSSISSLSSTISEDFKSSSPATTSEQYKLDPKYVSFGGGWQWREGAIHHGHPSIIPLLEFFEDAHFYYLILPAATPSFPQSPSFPPFNLPTSHPSTLMNGFAEKKFPSDLFDLVERFPYGLPPALIRTYLGQIADGLAFLHARGICHRDIKDENIVLAEDGRCWLIDFGSSGIVRKEGWDTFSGTLDYAGPEILRGEAYKGPPQDIWAFGIVSYVLVVGECPFSSASEAAAGLAQGSKALIALEERCGQSPPSNSPSLVDGLPPVLYPPPSPPSSEFPAEPPSLSWSDGELDFTEFLTPKYDYERERLKMDEGMEKDSGGRLGDAMALIKACLQLDVARRPSFDEVLTCRYLSGHSGWVDVDDISRA